MQEKKQYLIPYFISAHPGAEDEDMLNLALWLKKNNYECDQVQNFYPSPMCNATSMYYSETNPLKRVKYKKREEVTVAKGDRQRRLHKALLRYHDPENWKLIREALVNMGKKHLIGDKPSCLIPAEDIDAKTPAQRRQTGRHGAKRFATKHTKGQFEHGSQRSSQGEDNSNRSRKGPSANKNSDNSNQGNSSGSQRGKQNSPTGQGHNVARAGKPNQSSNGGDNRGNRKPKRR